MKYRCKTCNATTFDLVEMCTNCGGNEFETINQFQASHDSDVYTDGGDDDR